MPVRLAARQRIAVALPAVWVAWKQRAAVGAAEAIAASADHPARFLFRATEQTERFAADESPPTFAMLPGETIWNYGEPTYVDMVGVLRTAASRPDFESTLSPDSDRFPVSVASTVRVAMERFGEADAHEVESAFDGLVMEVDGFRHDDPPCYHVPMEVLGLR
jgi:hypothetical protein